MKQLQQWYRPVRVVYVIAAMLLLTASSFADSDLEKVLKQYDTQTVKGYIQPMADLFGANMNAGLFHSAAIPQTGFHLEVAIIGMASVVGDDQKKYTANAPQFFNPSTFETSTVFGGPGTTVRYSPNGVDTVTYSGTDGIIDASLFPLAVPQLTVGYIYGTEVTLRFISTPSISDDKFPKTTLFGIGARHSVSQYIPGLPVDIAAGIFYSSFTVGDVIDFSGLSIGAQASKSFAVLNLYGGLAWEKSTMNLNFASQVAGAGNVDLDLDGENNFRFTIGAGLNLAFLQLFADANFGSITNFSGGIGFGF